MFVCCEFCVLLCRAVHSSRGVLPTVLRRCLRSKNLKNEDAMARIGPQHHRKICRMCTVLFHDGEHRFVFEHSRGPRVKRAWPVTYSVLGGHQLFGRTGCYRLWLILRWETSKTSGIQQWDLCCTDEKTRPYCLAESVSYTGLDRLWELQEVGFPRISRQGAHEGGKVVSPTQRPPLPP
jgi:hypothetical protein